MALSKYRLCPMCLIASYNLSLPTTCVFTRNQPWGWSLVVGPPWPPGCLAKYTQLQLQVWARCTQQRKALNPFFAGWDLVQPSGWAAACGLLSGAAQPGIARPVRARHRHSSSSPHHFSLLTYQLSSIYQLSNNYLLYTNYQQPTIGSNIAIQPTAIMNTKCWQILWGGPTLYLFLGSQLTKLDKQFLSWIIYNLVRYNLGRSDPVDLPSVLSVL